MTESVEIVASTPLVQTSSSDLSTTVEEEQIKTLPLNGRNFVSLTRTIPGRRCAASPASNIDGAGSLAWRASAAFSANGQRPRDNNYLLDGVDNNETWLQTVVIFPSVDALDEFKLQTSTYSAEFGRSLGGVVNLQIKSGSERVPRQRLRVPAQRHVRRQQLLQQPRRPRRSRTSSRTSSAARSAARSFKDKTFFFGDYQGLRINVGRRPICRRCPRRGCATATSARSTASSTIRSRSQPFPNNVIPRDRWDPASAQRPRAALSRAEHGRARVGATGQPINNYLINPTLDARRTTSSTSRSTTT